MIVWVDVSGDNNKYDREGDPFKLIGYELVTDDSMSHGSSYNKMTLLLLFVSSHSINNTNYVNSQSYKDALNDKKMLHWYPMKTKML